MKKLKIMLMIVLSMVIAIGCTSKSPTDVVNTYFSEIKNGENADLAKYLLESVDSQDKDTENKEETKEDPKMEDAMKTYLSKLNVKVL